VAAPSAKSCTCPNVTLRVCGEDGKTYASPCMASCAGVKMVSNGACGTVGVTSIPGTPAIFYDISAQQSSGGEQMLAHMCSRA
jgi:hypothetical protein